MRPHPLPFVWPYALAFWGVFVWVFTPEWGVVRRARGRASDPQDAGSLWAIMIGNQIAMALALTLAWVAPSATIDRRVPLFWVGIAVLAAGSLLRRHCFRMLGQSFTGAVQVHTGQTVVDRGAYRWVRHPSYSAGIMMFAGIGLALGNWLSLASMVLITAAAYGYRVTVEERALAATLGEPYREYMRRTKRFVPYLV